MPGLEYEGQIFETLVGIDQVDDFAGDSPAPILALQAMAVPSRQGSVDGGAILTNHEVRPHSHLVGGIVLGHLDVCQQVARPRWRHLRVGVTGPQSGNSILETAAIIEGQRHFSSRIASAWCARYPVQALGGEEIKPFLVTAVIEESCLVEQEGLTLFAYSPVRWAAHV